MRPSLSWLGQILTYIEQNALAQTSTTEYENGVNPVDGPHTAFQTHVPLLVCPSDPRRGSAVFTHDYRLVGLTSYVGVCGTDYTTRDGVFFKDSKVRPADIRDGLSMTIMIGERPASSDNWYGWWYAGYGQNGSGSPDMLLGARERNDGASYAESCRSGPYAFSGGSLNEQCDLFHFWSLHPGGAHFVHADGSVHFHSYAIDPAILPALATIANNEVVAFD